LFLGFGYHVFILSEFGSYDDFATTSFEGHGFVDIINTVSKFHGSSCTKQRKKGGIMLTQVTTRHGTYEINPPEDLMEYIPEFLGNREKDFAALNAALKRKDYIEIFRLGHRIKGVCQPFGFEVLGKIAEEMEAAAHREDHGLCETTIQEFGTVLAKVQKDFPSLLDERPSTPALM
jgi:HPt (histidine-containing phosphotransfer) domain-containing protein